MRVLICGNRSWEDKKVIHRELVALKGVTCVIEGEARGADKLACEVAEELGIEVEKYPANWPKYGRAAGPIRNKQMLDEGKPDLVLAFFDSLLSGSNGTKSMVKLAEEAGIEVRVFS